MDDLDLLAEDAAFGVDIGGGHVGAVLPVGAGGGACARKLDHVDQLDLVLRLRGQAECGAERGGHDPERFHFRTPPKPFLVRPSTPSACRRRRPRRRR